MGNEQSLSGCEWKFEEPYHSFLYHKSVYVIANEIVAKQACDRLQKEKVIYIDCEGKGFGSSHAEIGLVQIAANRNNCYIFDVKSCKECLAILKHVLESSDIHKVFHDCTGDVAALRAVAGIQVQNVGDTQIAHFVENSTAGDDWRRMKKCSLPKLYKIVTNEKFPYTKVPTFGDNKWLDQRPLTDRMVQYAAVDALVLPQIYETLKCGIPLHEYKSIVQRSISSKCDRIELRSTSPEKPTSSRTTVESSSLGFWVAVGLVGAGVLLVAAAGVGAEMGKRKCEEKRKKEEEEQKRKSSQK